MCILAADQGATVLQTIQAHNIELPLEFIGEPNSSKMFGDLGWRSEGFADLAVTLNSHNNGIHPESFLTDAGLADMFTPTSISYTPDGNIPFIASMESKKYPFFGTQFHPEKTTAIFYPNLNVDHSWTAIELNRYLGDKFVRLARENPNVYGDFSTIQAAIIENYDSVVTDYWCG